MPVMRRQLRPIVGSIFAMLALCLLAGTAFAQSVPSGGGAGLSQLFQGLTPQERQAIMDQLGSGGGLGPGTSSIVPGFDQSMGGLNRGQSPFHHYSR